MCVCIRGLGLMTDAKGSSKPRNMCIMYSPDLSMLLYLSTSHPPHYQSDGVQSHATACIHTHTHTHTHTDRHSHIYTHIHTHTHTHTHTDRHSHAYTLIHTHTHTHTH